MNFTSLILALIFLFIIALIAIYLKNRKPRGSSYNVSSLEKKALLQLQKLRQELLSISFSQYNKSSYKYYKRIKIIMTVYTKEKYRVTINETINPKIMQSLLVRYNENEEDLKKLKLFFDAMKRVKEDGMKHSDMCALYESVILFFDGKVEKGNL